MELLMLTYIVCGLVTTAVTLRKYDVKSAPLVAALILVMAWPVFLLGALIFWIVNESAKT